MKCPVSRLVALALAGGVVTSGCATMLEGPREAVQLHFVPQHGVTLILDGTAVIPQNGTILLDKSRETHFLTVERTGFYPSTRAFDRTIDPVWAMANLIWGPLFPIAWFIDWQTSAGYRIDPADVHITLRRREERE